MNAPPSVLELNLSQEDVKTSLSIIFENLEQLRQKQVNDNKISDDDKNEYLHLTYRLASCIKALVSSDEKTIKNMQSIVDLINSNQALLHYDFFQDEFWKELTPDFSKSLDRLLIQLREDGFSGLYEKHHLLNALKYLAVEEQSLEERIEVYETILPFNDVLKSNNVAIFGKELKKLGAQKIQEIEGLKLKLGEVKDINKWVNSASSIGFAELQVPINSLVFDKEFKDKYAGSQIIDKYGKKPKYLFAGFLRKMIGITTPLSNPIITGLPHYLIKNINNYFKSRGKKELAYGEGENKYERYANWSFGWDFLHGISFGIAGFSTGDKSMGYAGVAYSVLGPFLRGVTTFLMYDDKNNSHALDEMERKPHGYYSLPILAALIPVFISGGIIKKARRDFLPPKEKLPDTKTINSVVSIKLQRTEAKKKKCSNYHEALENIACQELSEDAKINLEYGLDNHHTQGKILEKEIKERIANKSFPKNSHLEKSVGALTYYDVSNCEPYSKISAITFFQGKTYVMTYITEQKAQDFTVLSKILAKNTSFDEKLKELGELTDPEYLHLEQFEKNKKIEDKTYTK